MELDAPEMDLGPSEELCQPEVDQESPDMELGQPELDRELLINYRWIPYSNLMYIRFCQPNLHKTRITFCLKILNLVIFWADIKTKFTTDTVSSKLHEESY